MAARGSTRHSSESINTAMTALILANMTLHVRFFLVLQLGLHVHIGQKLDVLAQDVRGVKEQVQLQQVASDVSFESCFAPRNSTSSGDGCWSG